MFIGRSFLVLSMFATTACYWGAGAVEPVVAGGGQQCSVVGSWNGLVQAGVLAGRPVELTFWENGICRGTSGSIMLEVAWEVEGNELSIIHRDSIPPAAACRTELVGRYSLNFSADCSSLQVMGIEDLCEHRRRTLHALRGRRTR